MSDSNVNGHFRAQSESIAVPADSPLGQRLTQRKSTYLNAPAGIRRPAKKGDMIRGKQKKFVYLIDVPTAEEITALIDWASQPKSRSHKFARARFLVLLILIFRAGLRRVEACSITRADIDSARNQIHVRNAKGFKPRVVGIDDRAMEMLLAYVAWMDRVDCEPDLPLVHRTTYPSNVRAAYVGDYELHVCGGAFSRVARAAVKQLGLPKRRWNLHSIRHACAIAMMVEKISVPIISKQLGHASLEQTWRYLSAFDVGDLGEHMKRRTNWGVPVHHVADFLKGVKK